MKILRLGEKGEGELLNHGSCPPSSPSLKTPRLPRGGGSLFFANWEGWLSLWVDEITSL